MRSLPTKLKPASGFSHFIHTGLTLLLPALVYILIRIDFAILAFALVLLSKWRMLAVRPRYWLANIRSNAVDMLVSLSLVVFMTHTTAISWQLVWTSAYGLWQLFIKPGTSVLKVSIQAFLGQTLGLMSLFLAWKNASIVSLVIAVWAICYVSARHFFTSFEEQHSSLYAHFWAYFCSTLMWILGHWLLFYGLLAQPTLLISVIALGSTTLYYLDETDRLSVYLRRQFVFIMVAIIMVVLVFSSWGDKTV